MLVLTQVVQDLVFLNTLQDVPGIVTVKHFLCCQIGQKNECTCSGKGRSDDLAASPYQPPACQKYVEFEAWDATMIIA